MQGILIYLRGGNLVIDDICVKILSMYKGYQSGETIHPKKRTVTNLTFSHDALGFFDGVPQDGLYAIGVLLNLNDAHIFKMKLNHGRGYNTKDGLITLWCLCKVDLSFGLDSIKSYGDYLVIINVSFSNLIQID